MWPIMLKIKNPWKVNSIIASYFGSPVNIKYKL